MKAPTKKRLCDLLNLEPKAASLIKRLASSVDDRERLETLIEKHCAETWEYAKRCHSWPFDSAMWRRTMVLHAIDCIMDTYGVEALGECSDDGRQGPPFEYMNTGDSYVLTLVYDRIKDKLFISSWGDVVEREGL